MQSKQYKKEYYLKNKYKIQAQIKAWKEKHKEESKEKRKIYYQANIAKIKIQTKIYREKIEKILTVHY